MEEQRAACEAVIASKDALVAGELCALACTCTAAWRSLTATKCYLVCMQTCLQQRLLISVPKARPSRAESSELRLLTETKRARLQSCVARCTPRTMSTCACSSARRLRLTPCW